MQESWHCNECLDHNYSQLVSDDEVGLAYGEGVNDLVHDLAMANICRWNVIGCKS